MGVTRSAAAVAAIACSLAAGCGTYRCGCADGCGEGRQFALMKYEECCERCGDSAWGGPGVVAGSCGCNYCGPSGCASCPGCESCYGGCQSCGKSCRDCDCGDSVGCGDACGTCTECRVPIFKRLGTMFCRCARGGCNGCGELYWNEWYNDPPSCCQPCNCYGQYVGRGATSPHVMPYQSFAEELGTTAMPANAAPLEAAAPPEAPVTDPPAAPTEAEIDLP